MQHGDSVDGSRCICEAIWVYARRFLFFQCRKRIKLANLGPIPTDGRCPYYSTPSERALLSICRTINHLSVFCGGGDIHENCSEREGLKDALGGREERGDAKSSSGATLHNRPNRTEGDLSSDRVASWRGLAIFHTVAAGFLQYNDFSSDDKMVHRHTFILTKQEK